MSLATRPVAEIASSGPLRTRRGIVPPIRMKRRCRCNLEIAMARRYNSRNERIDLGHSFVDLKSEFYYSSSPLRPLLKNLFVVTFKERRLKLDVESLTHPLARGITELAPCSILSEQGLKMCC